MLRESYLSIQIWLQVDIYSYQLKQIIIDSQVEGSEMAEGGPRHDDDDDDADDDDDDDESKTA